MAASRAERIREKLREPPEKLLAGFLAVLREVADGLTGDGVVAEVVERRGGRRASLLLSPEHRPARSHVMLTVALDGPGRVTVLTSGPVFEDPEKFGAWLEEFVTTGAFRESLKELGAIARLPVEAFLRTGPAGTLSLQDLLVEVASDDQGRIAVAPEGERLEVDVAYSRLPGAGKRDEAATFITLDAAGHALQLEEVTEGARGMHLVGTKLRPASRGAS